MADPSPPFMMIVESEMERYRRDTWKSKEAETIAWIDSFAPGDALFDIGANVGVYTLYAASRGITVFAFEPDAKNFARLRENVDANAWLDRVTVAQYAVSDRDGEGVFYERGAVTGESGGQVNAALCNGMAAYPVALRTVDSLAAAFGCPTHVKVDIDGQELRVVRGMKATLANPALKSVLIEVDTSEPEQKFVISLDFMAFGFRVDKSLNALPNHSRVRRAAEGIRVENIVFTRES